MGGTTVSTKKNTNVQSGTACICADPKTRKYYSNQDCRGLDRCSDGIKSLSVSAARLKGFSPYKIHYR